MSQSQAGCQNVGSRLDRSETPTPTRVTMNQVTVTVRTDPTFAVTEQKVTFTFPPGLRPYFQHRRYDVSRDDQRFITFRQVGLGGEIELIVVENFFEELKAKVGN